MSIEQLATTHDVEGDALAAIEYCYKQGWADGLPVVSPEVGRIEAMLAMEGRLPETVIATHPAGNECTVTSEEVNAVMAGCLPEYFPVIVAGLEAANEPLFAQLVRGSGCRMSLVRTPSLLSCESGHRSTILSR